MKKKYQKWCTIDALDVFIAIFWYGVHTMDTFVTFDNFIDNLEKN